MGGYKFDAIWMADHVVGILSVYGLYYCRIVRLISFYLSDYWCLAVCILVMQRPDDTLNALYHFDATFLDNKSALYRKKKRWSLQKKKTSKVM